MKLVAALYPWDVLGDPGLIDRLTSLGVSRVNLAAYYHAVRAATPRHPDRRFVDAAHSAGYLDRSVEVGALRTSAPTWVAADAFLRARDRLSAAGLAVDAWITPSHRDPAGADDDAHRVIDAFGQPLRHALCPNDPIAAAFIDGIVEMVVSSGGDGVCVESLGQLGVDHAELHDKTAGADWTADERRLLSVCFCSACRQLHAGQGSDLDEVRRTVRRGLTDRSTASDAVAEVEEAVLAARSAGLSARWSNLLEAVQAATFDRVSVHATADRWATAPAAPIESVAGADVAIVDDWSADAAALARVEAVRDRHHGATAAYVTVLPPIGLDPRPLAEHWGDLAYAGVTELHVYHLGLASSDRTAMFEAASEAF